MDAFDALPDDFETALSPRTPTFRLFDLPAELWLYILALSVIRPYPIDPTWARTTPEQSLVVAQPAITRTCRVLRKEGLLLYYSLNTFESQHLLRVACTRDWMIAIGETNRKAMKTFYFHCEFEPEFWIGQFKQCGIEVGIEEAAPESAVAVRMRKRKNASAAAKTLIVSFSGRTPAFYCDAPDCAYIATTSKELVARRSPHFWCPRCDDEIAAIPGRGGGNVEVDDVKNPMPRAEFRLQQRLQCEGSSEPMRVQAAKALTAFTPMRTSTGETLKGTSRADYIRAEVTVAFNKIMESMWVFDSEDEDEDEDEEMEEEQQPQCGLVHS